MKLLELQEDSPLKLKIDNPGGSWLEGKRADQVERGRNEFGAYKIMGSTTAYWNRYPLVPVSVLARIPGSRGEQSNVRKSDFDWLHDYMSTNNKFPPLSGDDNRQYFPFVVIDQHGKPWVHEGNHRIMVAKKLGWEFIPVQMSYFNGGEQESGLLAPAHVKGWDALARKKGYSHEDFSPLVGDATKKSP